MLAKTPSPKISGVQLEISSLCNFKCQFCPVSGQGSLFPKPKKKFVEDEIVYRVIDAVKAFKLNYFTFSFIGEPMMNANIFEYMKLAKKADLPLMLVTNGTLLGDSHFDQINEAGLQILKISLQVADKDKFSIMRGIKMEYYDYLEKVTNVLRARTEGRIKCDIYLDVGFNPSYTLVNRLLGTYRGDRYIEKRNGKLAIDIKEYLNYLKKSNISHNHSGLGIKQIRNKLKKYWKNIGPRVEERRFLYLGNHIFLSIKPFWDHFAQINNYPSKHVNCRPNKIVIDIDGDVTVCNRDVMKKTVIANIYKESVHSVIDKARHTIDDISSGNCGFEYCHYCKGLSTKRGVFISDIKNNIFNSRN